MKSRSSRVLQATLVAMIAVAASLPISSADAEGPNACEAADLPLAAFGVCEAYCEAQRCFEQDSTACATLRQRFERATGRSTFPCDPACGDGVVNQASEECDPPGGVCGEGEGACVDCRCVDLGCEGEGCSSGDGRDLDTSTTRTRDD